MNAVIELHDSEIETLKYAKNEIRVFLSVIIHESDKRPGFDSGTVYEQKAEMLFQGECKLVGKIKEYPVLISDGILKVDDLCWENLVPISLDKTGKIKLNIIPRDISDEIIITADRVSLKLIGDPKYLEKFPSF
jgi:hypothetical protein